MTAGRRAGRAAFRAIVTGLVTSIALGVGIGFVSIAFGFEGEAARQLLGGAGMLVLMFAVTTAATSVMHRGRLNVPMALAIAAEVAATALVMHLIFDDDISRDRHEALSKLALACALVGVGLAHTGVCSLIRTSSRLLLVTKVLVMAGVWLAALLWTGFAIFEPFINNWMAGMTIVVTAMIVTVLAGLGTIVVPVAAYGRADRDQAPVESIERRLRIELECPKCRQMQEMQTGNPRCRNCHAWLTVEVEEPRCACGYLLYQLSGDYCPECGAPIPAELRWVTPPLRGGGTGDQGFEP